MSTSEGQFGRKQALWNLLYHKRKGKKTGDERLRRKANCFQKTLQKSNNTNEK